MGRMIFAPDEILKLAIKIEENGFEFYHKMSQKMNDEKLKNVLQFLAEEESKHKEIFQKLLNKLEETEIVESYSGEYEAYMNALVSECVFVQDIVKKKAEEGFANAISLLEFALRIEKDSILLYSELKHDILRNEEVLDSIINEERKHYVMISQMRSEIEKEENL